MPTAGEPLAEGLKYAPKGLKTAECRTRNIECRSGQSHVSLASYRLHPIVVESLPRLGSKATEIMRNFVGGQDAETQDKACRCKAIQDHRHRKSKEKEGICQPHPYQEKFETQAELAESYNIG